MGEELNAEPQTESNEKTNEQRLEEIKAELFDREMPPEYQPLIEGAKFIEVDEPYSENLVSKLDHSSSLRKLLAEEIKNNIVLDLGCGTAGWINNFSRKNGARLYIGVDLHPGIFSDKIQVQTKSDAEIKAENKAIEKKLLESFAEDMQRGRINDQYEERAKIDKLAKEPTYRMQGQALEVREDMLRAISRMKSNSVKLIVTSGIEVFSGKRAGEYITALINEAKRVLTDDGLLLNYESDVSYHESDMTDMVKIDSDVKKIDLRRKKPMEEILSA